MIEGQIIKFYREKEGWTQSKLVQGICSVTHLSKIERGITEYSHEITTLLAKRLDINIEKEVRNYHQIHQKLIDWHEAMIMQRTENVERLKMEIEYEPLKDCSDFLNQYLLLHARYHLFKLQTDQAYQLLTTIPGQEVQLTTYEQSLCKHIWGIYYFLTGQFIQCIEVLKSINQDQYNHQEYFYHLAIAYHSIHSNITSYYYAEKALHYFRKTLNMLRIIDTETIMIVQLNTRELHDFEETKQKYETLLKTCDTCHSMDRKVKLINNFAFEHFRRKMYREASILYEEAIKLINKEDPMYLICLEGYVQACYKGKLLSDKMLLELANEGLQLAEEQHNKKESICFTLHIYSIQEDHEGYYHFLETKALPHIRESGETIFIDHYEKKLFQYYLQKGRTADALELAAAMNNSRKSYYDHE